jgi:hypothetical protein
MMNPTLFGMPLLREIPQDTTWGLLAGQYTLHGGVVRWAPGTSQAGQIVRHLIPTGPAGIGVEVFGPFPTLNAPFSVLGIGQLSQLGTLTRQVLQVASTTMVLSGLNLVVSAVGFAIIARRLGAIESRLAAIQEDVKEIRALLERKDRAAMRAALETLTNQKLVTNNDVRRAQLVGAHKTFSELAHQYGDLLTSAETAEVALGAEEVYCLAFLARARCSAELGELALAHHELQTDIAAWTIQARRVTRDLLIEAHPERFLYREIGAVAPAALIADCFDFAFDTSKGYGWIDAMRGEMTYWHKGGPKLKIGLPKKGKHNILYEQNVVVPGLSRLSARHRVLDGHVAQMALLAEHGMSLAEFGERLETLKPAAVDGYLVL